MYRPTTFNVDNFQATGWNKPLAQQQKQQQKQYKKQYQHHVPVNNYTHNNNKPKNSVSQNPRVLQLESDIVKCSYHPINSLSVHQAVVELLRNYLTLDSSVFSFQQSKHIVSVIELKGFIEANGSIVFINIMLPQKFPQHPPNIRIINKQPDYLEVAPNYKSWISPVDNNSIILKTLNTLKQWNSESKMLPIMKEVENLLAKDPPFRQKTKMKKEHQIKIVEINQKPYNKNIPNQKPAVSANQQKKAQQLIKLQLADIVVRSTNYIQKTKLLTDSVLKQHKDDFAAIHNLQITKICLDNQIKDITKKNKEASQMISAQDQNVSGINIDKIISPTNDWSRQLLELISLEKAGQDTLDHLEVLFSEKKITFEQLLKFTRKFQQQKFLYKAMIKKKLANKS